MAALLCEAQKFGTIAFALPYPIKHYYPFREADKKLLKGLENDGVRSFVLDNEQLSVLNRSSVKRCRIHENRLYLTESIEDIEKFIKLDCMFFLSFLIENSTITSTFIYTEMNQEMDIIIDYMDDSKFKIREYISEIRTKYNKNIILSEDKYFFYFHGD